MLKLLKNINKFICSFNHFEKKKLKLLCLLLPGKLVRDSVSCQCCTSHSSALRSAMIKEQKIFKAFLLTTLPLGYWIGIQGCWFLNLYLSKGQRVWNIRGKLVWLEKQLKSKITWMKPTCLYLKKKTHCTGRTKIYISCVECIFKK